MRHALFFAALLSFACAAPQRPAPAPSATAAAPAARSGVTFIHDDFDQALAMARAQNKPLFVDAWAPW